LPNYKDQSVTVELEDGKTELAPAKCPVRMRNLLTMTSRLAYPDEETPAGKAMKEAWQN
jgi:CubicO group peptidase (beta-lactamase class C family)